MRSNYWSFCDTILVLFSPVTYFRLIFLTEVFFFVPLSKVVVIFVVQSLVFPDIVSWDSLPLTKPAD